MDRESPKETLEHHAVPPFPQVFKIAAATLLLYLLAIFLASGGDFIIKGHHP